LPADPFMDFGLAWTSDWVAACIDATVGAQRDDKGVRTACSAMVVATTAEQFLW
jgi:hypothetical protein